MKITTLLGPVAVLALLAGCAQKAPEAPAAPPAPPPPDAAAIRSELTATLEKITAALTAKDSAGFAAFFTEDATWVLPNAATYQGSAEIKKGTDDFIAQFETVTFGAAAIEKLIVVSDTEAVTFSNGTFTITTKKQKSPETRSNPFADYWQKGADGTWRIAYEINAEGPMPAAPAQP
jgi:uncharacterized protein (TIGR02246 family)